MRYTTCTLSENLRGALFAFLLIGVTLLFLLVPTNSFAVTGITYTGRILDSNDQPVVAPQVFFTATIYDEQSRCALYTEQRQLDLSAAAGTFSFDIGSNDSSLVSGSAGFNTGITSISDVFNNGKTYTGLNGCASGPNTYTPTATSPRVLGIIFKIGAVGTPQSLPALTVNPVPTAMQAFEVNGYGTGLLLKTASTVDQTTNSNTAMTQAQYDEFWRVVKNPLAAYLPATGDVVNSSGSNKLTTLLGQALPAGPATNNQILVSNGTTWALQALSTGSVTSVGVTAPITNSGTATAPVIAMPAATGSQNGYLTSADWTAFNAKMSAALVSGKIFIGNASGVAEAQSVSGDATLAAGGALTLKNTGTAGTYGSASLVPIVTTDAQGRVTGVTTAAPLDATKLPLAGGSMSGDIVMGGNKITGMTNVPNVAVNPAVGQNGQSLRWNNTTPGWEWFTAAASGAGITSLNGQTGNSQSFAAVDLGTSVTAPAFSSASDVHTLKIPMASDTGVTAGLLSKTNFDRIGKAESLNGKDFDVTAATTMGQILFYDSVADKLKVSAATAPADGEVLKWDNTLKIWKPGADTGGWTAVDSSYAAKGIVQFDTSAAVSGVTVTTGVASVVRTTTGTSSTILSLDGSGIANMYAAGLKGATSGTLNLQASGTTTNYSITFPAAAPGIANQVLVSNATGTMTWASNVAAVSGAASLTTGKMWIGNAGVASEVSMSGDATINTNGALTLASTITAGGPTGGVSTIPVITYDAKGRLTAVTTATVDDTTKLPLAGGTMSGNIAMGGNKITGLTNVPNVAANPAVGQDGMSLRWNNTTPGWEWFTAAASGAGITSLNGQSGNSQSYGAIDLGTSVTAPAWSSASNVHTLKIPMASDTGVTAGLITKTQYDALNNKQSNLLADSYILIGNSSGGAQARQMSGDATINNTGVVFVDKTQAAAASKILQLDASSVALTKGNDIGGASSGKVSLRYPSTATNTTLTFPNTAGSASQFLQTDGAGNLTWAAPSATLPSLADSLLWIGNSSGGPQARAMSGDATISNGGALALKNTGTAGTYGSAILVPVITTDAQGRVTGVTTAAPLDGTKLPLAGGTMSGDIAMGGNKITGMTNVPNVAANPAAGQTGQALRWNNTTPAWEWYTPVASGSAITTLNGLTAATQTFGTIDMGTSVTAPAWSSATSTHTLKIPMASDTGVTGGLITKVQYDTLNNKQSNLLTDSYIWIGNSSGGAQARQMSGDATINNTGVVFVDKTQAAAASKILQLDASSVALTKGNDIGGASTGKVSLRYPSTATNTTLTFPNSAGSASQFLQTDGAGNLTWATASGGGGSLPSINAGQIWVGNASNGPQAFSLSGDVSSVSNLGVVVLNKTTTAQNNLVLSLDGSGVGNVKGIGFVNTGTVTVSAASASNTYSLVLPAATPVAGQILQSDASGNLSWVTSSSTSFVNGGNTFAGNSTIGLNNAYDLGFKTNGTTQMTLTSGGKLGVGNAAPTDTLQVSGTIRGASFNNASSTTIDWSKGNSQYTAAGCTGTQYTFSNMRDGGVYTLAITGTFSATCTFGQTSPDTLSGTPGSGAFYFLPANSIPSGSNSVYSFMRVGNNVYVQWNSGFTN